MSFKRSDSTNLLNEFSFPEEVCLEKLLPFLLSICAPSIMLYDILFELGWSTQEI